MQKLNIKLNTAVRNNQKDVPAPGHEHHTNIDVAGTGSDDFNFPSTEDLVKRSLKRAAREAKNQRKRDRKAGKSVTQPQGNSDDTSNGECCALLSFLATVKFRLPPAWYTVKAT